MPTVECRRFLHTNYNCSDVEQLERWYTAVFGLRVVMKSVTEGSDTDAFGIYAPTSSTTSFVYDHRGGRRATSLELVQWTDPPTTGRPYPRAWDRGIQSYGFRVPDLAATVELAVAEGGDLVHRTDRSALLRDPQGVAVEVVVGAVEKPEANHLRIVCTDIDESAAWYEEIGVVATGSTPAVPGGELWPAEPAHLLTRELAIAAKDDADFSVLLTQWVGPDPIGPTYAMPFHQGLYRMAIAVDDVTEAYAALKAEGIARQPPTTFALPGTKLTAGLTILFVRDPDGILVELVERPPSSFRD